MKRYLMGFLIGVAVLFSHTESIFAQDDQKTRPYFYDASLHYVLSAEITFASCMFFTLQNPEMTLTKKYLLASGVGTFVGFAKEFTDLIDSYFDWSDIGFDLLGVGTGIVLHYFVFDKKMKRSNLSFNISEDAYIASVKFYF